MAGKEPLVRASRVTPYRRRVGVVIALFAAGAVIGGVTGCAAPHDAGEYFGDRVRDFADCWRASAGPALGLHVRASAIILQAGEGFAWGRDFGWDGPGGAFPPTWRRLSCTAWVPIVFFHDVDIRAFPPDAPWKPYLAVRLGESPPPNLAAADVTDITTDALVTGYRWKHHGRTLPRWTRVADLYWVEADVTPLLFSVRFGFNPLEFLDWLAGLVCVDMLSDDHFVADVPGAVEIIAAAGRGEAEAVRALLSRNRRLAYARDPHGTTPLHAAAREGYEEIVLPLLSANAERHARDDMDRTPADLAEDNGHGDLARFLRR